MENEITPVQTDKIKLIKNTKGYNWEISILSHDIDELERINAEMKRRFEINDFHKQEAEVGQL